MRMVALVCVDGLIPFGANFIEKAQSTLSQTSPQELEQKAERKPLHTLAKRNRQKLVCSWGLYPTTRLTHSRVVPYRTTCTAEPLGFAQRPES